MVLLIDNYDSFTYMLRDYVMQCGEECLVVRNNEMTIADIKNIAFDSIIISPGPGYPAGSGITPHAIKAFHDTKPILGICLGHQALGEFYGASLVQAERPMHGKTSMIRHSAHPIFKDMPEEIEVMRYHSLILEKVPAPIEVIAETVTGEIMGIAHPARKIAGLQYHPESILSTHGLQMIQNWFRFIK